MKAIVCDKCKKVITDDEVIKDTMRIDFSTPNLGKCNEKYLCRYCEDMLYQWLNNKEGDSMG